MNILLIATDTTATASEIVYGSGNLYNDVLMVVLIIVMLALIASAIVIQKAMRSILMLTVPALMEEEKIRKSTKKTNWKAIWEKMLGLRPIEEEKDLLIDHEYDGIKELDNPIPLWFNALFYSSVTFGIVYFLVYHVFGWGLLQDAEYKHEMAAAEKAKQEYLAQSANLIDENSVTLDVTGVMATAGQAVYIANCVACHGEHGEGGIGPNLADNFWIHGGEIKDVFKIVKYGVADKGMVPWEQTLSPGQIAEVSNYIVGLRGTTPANAKEPQGVEVVYEAAGGAAAAADSSATTSAE